VHTHTRTHARAHTHTQHTQSHARAHRLLEGLDPVVSNSKAMAKKYTHHSNPGKLLSSAALLESCQ
jgi:hypothetical protein